MIIRFDRLESHVQKTAKGKKLMTKLGIALDDMLDEHAKGDEDDWDYTSDDDDW